MTAPASRSGARRTMVAPLEGLVAAVGLEELGDWGLPAGALARETMREAIGSASLLTGTASG